MAVSLLPADILGPEGSIAKRLSGYEHRQEQLAMADAVLKAISQQHHLVVEAGTGVGKSFAYLVPAILSTDRTTGGEPKRIVISTHTISLQEQLLRKDLPFLRSVMPIEFTAVLVKGRGNYISLRRLQNAEGRAGAIFHDAQELKQLADIGRWSQTTTDGSRSDLPFRPASPVWDEVQSEHGNCMGKKCPRFRDCFYYAARRRSQNAQILVVNHALFCSDLALRQEGVSILPDYDVAIFDEAHTLEAVASEHLGLSVSSGQIDYLLNKLYNDRTNKGLLVHHHWGEAQQLVLECRARTEDFFADLRDWLDHRPKHNGRITQADIVPNGLSSTLEKLAKLIRDQAEALTNEEEQQDCTSAVEKLRNLAQVVRGWLQQTETESVYWMDEVGGRRPRLKLACAPLDIGPTLRSWLFETVPTVILTSATLATGKGAFDFFQSRVGLSQAQTLQLGSPFDYQKQARIIVTPGMPDPSQKPVEYERRVLEMIRRYVDRTDGRTFVLFTSYQMLRSVVTALTPWLVQKKLAILSQAEGLPRTQMVDQFKANPRSVLFGTDSFWQGVDVPGDALQTVIITKLPFSVPDRPLLAARLDAIRTSGGNPFVDYQLPEAVIKLKQGFGRLIRSRLDTGQVVILDPRILTKPYGRTFLESLPPCQLVREPLHPVNARD